jgi:ferritin-like metal-binding protein YciE
MALKQPIDLLTQELKEIHSAERQVSRALPKLTKTVQSQALRKMFERRRDEGATVIELVDDALEDIGTTKSRPKNAAIEGLLEDANQHVEDIQDERMLDAALLAGVQKIQHYCIAAWGTSKSLGNLLDQQKVVEGMERALEEGRRFDQEMTELAENEINPAMLAGQEEQQEEGSSRSRRKSA